MDQIGNQYDNIVIRSLRIELDSQKQKKINCREQLVLNCFIETMGAFEHFEFDVGVVLN